MARAEFAGSMPSPVGRGPDKGGYCGAAGAGLTSPLRMICATCCFSIFTALSCPLTVGLSGASACTLPLAVSWRLPSPLIGSNGQPPGLQNIQRHAAAGKAQIDLALRQLGYRGSGLQNAALGEGAKLSDIDRRRCRAQLE